MINQKISEIIRSRQSIYPQEYTGELIKKESIIEILENASYAPTHKMTQPWIFKIFNNNSKEKLLQEILKQNKSISEAARNKLRNKFNKSSHIICICMKRNNHLLPEWEEIASTAMAVQNMWLSCVGSNIGGYWSSPKYSNKLKSFLSLDENERCLGFFYLGIYKNNIIRNTKRININERIKWFK